MKGSSGVMKKTRLFFKILDEKRHALLPKLEFLRKEYGFYLAGGTALALQIGHRTSVDFDFYTPRTFDPGVLYRKLKEAIPMISPVHTAKETLMVGIPEKKERIEMSFFRYDYPLLRPLMITEYLDLVSVEDIAAMKIIAIVQRGTKRDFVDIYYLLKRYNLETLLKMTTQKYSAFNRYIGLRGLTYFEDAEIDKSRGRLELFEKLEWDSVKKNIAQTVAQHAKEQLHQ